MSEQKLDIYTYAAQKGAYFSVGIHGIEWVARCVNPRCSSLKDAFSVQPEGKQYGRWAGYGAWMCRKCWDPAEMVTVQYGPERGTHRKRGWGTIADLVMLCEGIAYREAERFILEYEGAPIPLTKRPALTAKKSDAVWFAETLQYLQASQTVNEQDRELLHSYLASRGLIIEMALQLGYGFSRDNVLLNDKTFRKIPFLVIPWYKDKATNTLYRKVNRRNLHASLPGDEAKYYARAQSNNDALYLGESLLASKRPTFLVESELDAATVLQEAGDLVNVVGTGTAKGSRNAVNAARLRRQPFVFVSFDDDPDGAQASMHWMGELEPAKCVRYKPLMHDANEMHTSGLSIRSWVEAGLALFVASPPPEQPQEPASQDATCCKCGTPAKHASPSGYTYCTEHYQCIRGHMIRWRKGEDGRWLCACYSEESWNDKNSGGSGGSGPENKVNSKLKKAPDATLNSGPLPPLPPLPEHETDITDIPSFDEVDISDNDDGHTTEPLVKPILHNSPVLPTVNCAFCNIAKWIWSPQEQDHICLKCYSPLASTLKNNQIQARWEVTA